MGECATRHTPVSLPSFMYASVTALMPIQSRPMELSVSVLCCETSCVAGGHLFFMQSLDRHTAFSYWLSFLPDGPRPPNSTPSLLTCLLKDPTPKVCDKRHHMFVTLHRSSSSHHLLSPLLPLLSPSPFTLSPPHSHSPSLPPPHSLPLPLIPSLHHSLSPSLPLPLTPSPPHSLFPSLLPSLPLPSPPLSPSLPLPVTPSPPHSLSPSSPLPLPLTPSPPHSLSPSLPLLLTPSPM